jgi:hypothetical protein
MRHIHIFPNCIEVSKALLCLDEFGNTFTISKNTTNCKKRWMKFEMHIRIHVDAWGLAWIDYPNIQIHY